MNLNRRINALRALAERPGTEAEGILARDMLARAEGKQRAPKQYPDIVSITYPGLSEVQQRFPKGTRVYYNQWAYSVNDPGTVSGYSRNGWVRIKFDRLKNIRPVPVFSQKGWHLSTEPISQDVLDATGIGGFTKAEKDSMKEWIYSKLRTAGI